MDIYKFLKEAERVEIIMSQLYLRFSNMYSGDEELAFLFRQLSREEDQHQELIQFELKLVMNNRGEFKEVDLPFEEIAPLLKRAEEVLRNPGAMAPADALKLAMEFEKSVAETHMRKAITLSNPKISNLMNSLGKKDAEHYDFLAKLARKRGILPVERVIPQAVPASAEAEELAGAVVGEEKTRPPQDAHKGN